MSATAESSGTPKPARVLACVLCQQRRIKCDRQFPCANCLKGNKICVPATPAPVRKRRRFKPDLQERLARCEALLKEYATAKPGDSPSSTSGLQAWEYSLSGNYNKVAAARKPTGKLVEDDGGVRFMDSPLLGTVYDELKAMRDLIDNENAEESSPGSVCTPDDGLDLLTGDCDWTALTLDRLQPSPAHVFRLWQIYTERVNPLTKIIHVPSVQPYMVEAAANPAGVPKNIQALLFSIYTLATISMSTEECQSLFGCSRESAVRRFSSGAHISLNRANFLKNHNLEILQALLIYLISLQNRYNRHALWLLTGVVVRMAQKMGLHRDGKSLGLSPFDTEMRRRVWWQILMLDSKYACLSGMNQEHLPRSFDTEAPKNVNDADLFPSATDPVQDREGPTEMIWILLVNNVTQFLVEVPDLEPLLLVGETEGFKSQDSPMKERLMEYRQKLNKLGNAMIETIDRYCDPSAGLVHEMTMDVHRFMRQKMEEILKPPEHLRYYSEIKNSNDNAFRIAVGSIDHYIHQQLRTRDTTFHWYFRLHLQVHIIQYIVSQLCYRAEGELVEKAWEVLPLVYEFHGELYDVSQKGNHDVAVFVLKAWSQRQATLHGQSDQTPEYIARLQSLVPEEDIIKLGQMLEKTSISAPNPMVVDQIQEEADPTLLGQFQVPADLLDIDVLNWDVWQDFGGRPNNASTSALGGYGMEPTVNSW